MHSSYAKIFSSILSAYSCLNNNGILTFHLYTHFLCLALKEKLGKKNQETPVMTRLVNLAPPLTQMTKEVTQVLMCSAKQDKKRVTRQQRHGAWYESLLTFHLYTMFIHRQYSWNKNKNSDAVQKPGWSFCTAGGLNIVLTQHKILLYLTIIFYPTAPANGPVNAVPVNGKEKEIVSWTYTTRDHKRWTGLRFMSDTRVTSHFHQKSNAKNTSSMDPNYCMMISRWPKYSRP